MKKFISTLIILFMSTLMVAPQPVAADGSAKKGGSSSGSPGWRHSPKDSPDIEVLQEDFIIMGVLIGGIIVLEYSCPD